MAPAMNAVFWPGRLDVGFTLMYDTRLLIGGALARLGD